MNRETKKSLSKLKINDEVYEAAVSQWDFWNEKLITGPAFSDEEVIKLDDLDLNVDEVFDILYDANCKKLAEKLAKEMAKITIARIKETADFLKEQNKPKNYWTRKR